MLCRDAFLLFYPCHVTLLFFLSVPFLAQLTAVLLPVTHPSVRDCRCRCQHWHHWHCGQVNM